jgi:signal transduction histidine kinase
LHDELGAVLSIARMHLIQLEEHSAEVQLASIRNIRTLTESALVSMRRISHELMPAQLESFGLVKTLEALATRTNTERGIQLHVLAEELPTLPWSIQLGLYRICLELITNTLKHADAHVIELRIVYRSSYLVFYYQDDGKGLPSSAIEGLGTTNIEARVSALSERIVPSHSDGGGFALTLEIPLNNQR